MFENPRRGRQARNLTTNAPKILVLKSSSEQIFSRKLPLGAPVQWKPARERATDCYIFQSTALFEFAMHYTKKTTINKQILCRFQKNFFQGSENWNSPSFLDVLRLVRHFFELKNSRVRSFYLPRTHKRSSEGIFFFTSLISHCLKSQLSKYYGEKTLLGAAKSLEVTFPRVSRRGRHFANVGDVIIYSDLVVARTEVWLSQLKRF